MSLYPTIISVLTQTFNALTCDLWKWSQVSMRRMGLNPCLHHQLSLHPVKKITFEVPEWCPTVFCNSIILYGILIKAKYISSLNEHPSSTRELKGWDRVPQGTLDSSVPHTRPNDKHSASSTREVAKCLTYSWNHVGKGCTFTFVLQWGCWVNTLVKKGVEKNTCCSSRGTEFDPQYPHGMAHTFFFFRFI